MSDSVRANLPKTNVHNLRVLSLPSLATRLRYATFYRDAYISAYIGISLEDLVRFVPCVPRIHIRCRDIICRDHTILAARLDCHVTPAVNDAAPHPVSIWGEPVHY